jgi:hypothetical protein
MLALLLQHGANPHLPDGKGTTPAQLVKVMHRNVAANVLLGPFGTSS